MKKYKLKIEPEALADIQEITDWYNEQQAGLGKRFQDTAIKQINSLSKDPQIYAIRYIKKSLISRVLLPPFIIHIKGVSFNLNK